MMMAIGDKIMKCSHAKCIKRIPIWWIFNNTLGREQFRYACYAWKTPKSLRTINRKNNFSHSISSFSVIKSGLRLCHPGKHFSANGQFSPQWVQRKSSIIPEKERTFVILFFCFPIETNFITQFLTCKVGANGSNTTSGKK